MKPHKQQARTEARPSEPWAALYMRVSTGRQAEHDLSIPDQRQQLQSWCRGHGYAVVAEFVEAGASASLMPRAFVIPRTQKRERSTIPYQQTEKPEPELPKTGVVLCSRLYIDP